MSKFSSESAGWGGITRSQDWEVHSHSVKCFKLQNSFLFFRKYGVGRDNSVLGLGSPFPFCKMFQTSKFFFTKIFSNHFSNFSKNFFLKFQKNFFQSTVCGGMTWSQDWGVHSHSVILIQTLILIILLTKIVELLKII